MAYKLIPLKENGVRVMSRKGNHFVPVHMEIHGDQHTMGIGLYSSNIKRTKYALWYMDGPRDQIRSLLAQMLAETL